MFNNNKSLWLILILGITLRILLNDIFYSKDAQSFVFWGDYLRNHSISNLFEFLPGGFTPLPPFFYYLTRALAQFVQFLNLWDNHYLTYLVFKIPIISAEIITSILIFNFTAKYLGEKKAPIAAAFYFLHPAIIYNTAIWGQIDSFVSAAAFIALLLIIKKRFLLGLITYLIGILTKLQDFGIFPIIAFLAITNLWLKKLFTYGLLLTAILVILFAPVIADKGIVWTAKYFYQLPNWYPYTSIYAYNLWAPTGFITSDKIKFLSLIPYKFIGLFLYWTVAMLIIKPLLSAKKQKPHIILFAAFLLFYDFAFFETRIHSRYLIYSLPFAAPFFPKFPIVFSIQSIFIVLNLMLPMQSSAINDFVTALNNKTIIVLLTAFGLVLFLSLVSKYKILLKETK